MKILWILPIYSRKFNYILLFLSDWHYYRTEESKEESVVDHDLMNPDSGQEFKEILSRKEEDLIEESSAESILAKIEEV